MIKITQLEDGLTIGITESHYPDGQRHVKINDIRGTYDGGHIQVQASINNGDELFALLLVEETLRAMGAKHVDLIITYLLGARMDRRICVGQPYTLKVVADILKTRFESIAIVDPHSHVACELLNARAILPVGTVKRVIELLGWKNNDGNALCAPDLGSLDRLAKYSKATGRYVVECLKHRDSETGELSGFRLTNPEKPMPKNILICDDAIDGGKTFSEVAKLLKANGAEFVALYATHGILSGKIPVPGIDKIFIANTYREAVYEPQHVTVIDWKI